MSERHEFHAYDQSGAYVGIYIATAEQLAEQGLTAGAEPVPDPVAVLARARAAMPPLSFAQRLIGLVAEGWITEAEGEAWLAGTLPAAVLAVIAGLPEAMRFAAKARAARPSQVIRTDPLVAELGVSAGKTPEQLDAFFATYVGA